MLEWDFDDIGAASEPKPESSLIIIDCDQNTEEWLLARLGIPTASMFHAIMANGDGAGRLKYMYRLAGERITEKLSDNVENKYTKRGHVMEDEASNYYALMTGQEPEKVGFIRNGDVGCSPDRLVTDSGLLEIKTKIPEILIPELLANELPREHKPQVQGQLWVAEREWCDFVAYWPGMPPLIVRVNRDEDYIKLLANSVHKFNEELEQVEQKIRAMF